MPLGAARLCFLAKSVEVAVEAEVIRLKTGVTAFGDAQIATAQSKFGGSSLLLDGTGDYLTAANKSQFGFGTGDFTLEAWIRPTATQASGFNTVLTNWNVSGSQYKWYLSVQGTFGTSTTIQLQINGASVINVSTGTAMALNTWYHVAAVRSSGQCKVFLDGTQLGSDTANTANITATTGPIGIGVNDPGTSVLHLFTGYMDEIRISDNARYTTSFTPSTTPFVNDANTLLLLHCDGTNTSTYFEDDNGQRSKKSVRLLNGAQIDTAQSKFGGGSLLLDGTNDYGLVHPTPDFELNGDFTIECWIRTSTRASGGVATRLLRLGTNSGSAAADLDLAFYSTTYTDNISVFTNALVITGSIDAVTGDWVHVALSRSGTDLKLFVNGTQSGSTYTTSTNFNTGTSTGLNIGWINSLGGYYTGHIDELRISDSARYTTSFTPSTTPFVNDSNTVLLLHFDGTDAVTQTNDDNGVRKQIGVSSVGGAQIDTAQSKFGGSSALFDGTDDYLDLKPQGGIDLTGDFTIEFWWRVADTTAALIPFFDCSTHLFYIGQSSGTKYILFRKSGSVNVALSSALTVSNNTWYKVSFVRSGSSFKMYHDGVEVYSSASYGETITVNDTTTFIGKYSTYYVNGHLDEYRISDSQRYTTAYTPATTQFQNDTNTQLLLHFDGTDGSTVFRDDNGVAPDHSY